MKHCTFYFHLFDFTQQTSISQPNSYFLIVKTYPVRWLILEIFKRIGRQTECTDKSSPSFSSRKKLITFEAKGQKISEVLFKYYKKPEFIYKFLQISDLVSKSGLVKKINALYYTNMYNRGYLICTIKCFYFLIHFRS